MTQKRETSGSAIDRILQQLKAERVAEIMPNLGVAVGDAGHTFSWYPFQLGLFKGSHE